VDELFELFDLSPREFFRYRARKNICNYFWEDGTTFSASADLREFTREAAAVFNTPAEQISNYLAKSRRKYETTAGVFLERSLHRWSTYLSLDTLRSLLSIHRLDIGKSLHQLNEQQFSHPHLIQLFDRYATYNGSSPYQTPGIMSLIPHLEMYYGTYFPEGGMHRISQSLYQLAESQGVHFHFENPVQKILHAGGKALGVEAKNGSLTAELVVSNMDIFSTYHKLLKDVKKPGKTLQQERSSSALIFYWGIERSFPQLDLHNILFSENYRAEFSRIFREKTLYDDPTIYINITARAAPEDAPAGCENWFVMINTPGNYGQDWKTLKRQARQHILQKIKRILKVDPEPYIRVEEVLDPIRIESRTSSHRGALYGASSNSRFSAFLRHPNFSSRIKNLYFCGGSVHPGGGIPLCLLSAKITANLIPDPATK
jgi:phytoene desaturase